MLPALQTTGEASLMFILPPDHAPAEAGSRPLDLPPAALGDMSFDSKDVEIWEGGGRRCRIGGVGNGRVGVGFAVRVIGFTRGTICAEGRGILGYLKPEMGERRPIFEEGRV